MSNQIPFYFPFGKELTKVEQQDKTPKKVFVLGVYASAVHARWTDANGGQLVSALAIASEPNIFWTGENAEQIISSIYVPERLGRLSVPKDINLNGPSGRALDNLFLNPIGLNRSAAWLCDLLPESRVNEAQRKAINKYYTQEIVSKNNLTSATIPNFDKAELNSERRRNEILEELEQSKAEVIILLGDLPIYWFLRFFERKFTKLSQFGETLDTYGRQHPVKINNRPYNIIPLCHPRQADRLGSSNAKWGMLHDNWVKRQYTL